MKADKGRAIMKSNHYTSVILAFLLLFFSACGSTSSPSAAEPESSIVAISPATTPTPAAMQTTSPTPPPSVSPTNTPKPSPAPTPKLSDDEILENTTRILNASYSTMDGVTDTEIAYDYDFGGVGLFEKPPKSLAFNIQLDQSVYPVSSFQDFVLEAIDRLERNTADISGERRIKINIRYDYSADTQLSWYHHLDTEDLYTGSLTYGGGEGSSVSDISANDINYYLGIEEFTTITPVNTPDCTYEEYQQIDTGMSYDDVVSIIGSDGVELSSATIAGYTSKVYQWDGSAKYSNVVIQFQNDAVISKAQSGLE